MKAYIVMAYRFGGTENTFPIGVFSTHEEAVAAAQAHYLRRGGKYEHRILPFVLGVASDKFKAGAGESLEQVMARKNISLEPLR
jgi:hypothetical protein